MVIDFCLYLEVLDYLVCSAGGSECVVGEIM